MELVYVNDKAEIEKCADVVWQLCQESYEKIGGFLSIKDRSDFSKRVSQLKLVLETDPAGSETIGGCGIYRFTNNGMKAVGYASNKRVPTYRECVRAIIQDDIANYDKWYWVEASHTIERWFDEMGGYAIPNMYVSEFTRHQLKPEDLDEDGFHYNVTIGGHWSTKIVKKRLFGFCNQEMYDSIIAEYENLQNFVNYVRDMAKSPDNILTEAIAAKPEYLPKNIQTLIMFIYNFDETCQENDFYEVPPEWMNLLRFAMKHLKAYAANHPGRAVEESIDLGNELLATIQPLELHQFHAPKPMPHSTI